MIMYFSATGNTHYVATLLANLLGDETTDLMGRMHADDTNPIHSDKPFVLCAPVYVDGLPLRLMKHLADTPLRGSDKAYALLTMGAHSGVAGRMAQRLFTSKQMEFLGWSDVAMPRNYPVLTMVPDEKTESIEGKILAAPERVRRFAGAIARLEAYEERRISNLEYGPTLAFIHLWERIGYPTRKPNFRREDRQVETACTL